VPLTVPRPTSRYAASVRIFRFIKRVELGLAVTPLGDRLPYRVCYRLVSKQRRCLRGAVDGYDWNSRATDTLSPTTRRLPRLTTFTLDRRGKTIAVKRVRV
jgi:hypothetical protein